jgi:hypothetical protein
MLRIRARIASLAIVAACGGTEPQQHDAAIGFDGAVDTAVVTPATFLDKVLLGYQGWFAAPGDGSPLDSWYHWGHGTPVVGDVTFELYPDVRDYPPTDVFPASFGPLGSGAPARLFGSWSDGVIETHFRWLTDNGLDGVALQRFVVALYDPVHLRQRNEVAAKVRAASEQHGKLFYVTYDISGARAATWVEDIKHDFADVLRGQLDLLASPQYARQGGKPVVGVWGFGFPDRPGEAAESLALVEWLQAQGVYVMGGVPYTWRTGNNTKPGFAATFAALDMVQPWAVGTVTTDAIVDSHFADIVAKDKALTDSRGQDYQRVIFPGFAWSNWNGGARNLIPRRGGRLFWRQAYQAARSHVSTMIAMLDEYDEGTAIGRAAEDASQIPVNQYFLTLDADGEHLSSDFYLRLAGAATRMLQGKSPIQPVVPITAN